MNDSGWPPQPHVPGPRCSPVSPPSDSTTSPTGCPAVSGCRSRTASGCSNAPTCSPSAGSPTASASAATGRRRTTTTTCALEATNVCVASCLFCSFARLEGRRSRRLHDVARAGLGKLRERQHQPLTEVHVVNGLHPDLPFSYYTDLLSGFKRIRPGIHLKCVHRGGDRVLRGSLRHERRAGARASLMAAGLDSLPAAAPRSSPSGSAARSATTSATATGTSRSTASPIASACART